MRYATRVSPSAGLRLLIVVNDAAFFLSHRLPIALGALQAGYDVHVATPEDGNVAKICREGLSWHSITLSRRGTAMAGEAQTIQSLVRLYRDIRPSLVHHVTAKPILYGGIAARIAGVPSVVHAISGLGYTFISESRRARAMRAGMRVGYAIATSHPNCAMIFQNEDDRRMFGRWIRTKNFVLIRGSGVDRKVFAARALPNASVPLVVLPARMLWDKGVGELVESARVLRNRGVPARFALVGGIDDGNPSAIPLSTIETWSREGVVEWWGHREDMAAILEQASVVCLPSYREGMPKALLEACTIGRPIVTTDVPGCRDVVAGRAFGLLVPPRDVTSLTEALESLLSDRARREKMAAAAVEASPEFSIDEVVAQTLDLYRRLHRTAIGVSAVQRVS